MFGITFSVAAVAIGLIPYSIATALATWLFSPDNDNPFTAERRNRTLVESLVITVVGVVLMILAVLIAAAIAEASGGLGGLFAMPIIVAVIASGYAVLGGMLYDMEFGTGFGYGVTILTLHILTAWGLARFVG